MDKIISPRARLILAGTAILAMSLVAYVPALSAGFIWDDDDYVVNNDTLRSLSGLGRIWSEPGATAQYYPLVHTSFYLEYQLWGLNPLGYHLVNVLLHASAALLLWRVLKVLQLPGAWFVAAVFAVHPVCVESVAWITERKNVLSGVFYFAAALCYLRFNPPDCTMAPVRPRRGLYVLSLLLFAAALLSKTVVATLPAALLVVLWWKRGRIGWRNVAPLLGMFLLGAAMGLVTAYIEKTSVGAEGSEWDFSIVERFLIAGRALWFYAGKIAAPLQLTFMYPRWEVCDEIWWQYIFPIAVIAVLSALWMFRQRIGRGPLAGVLVFAGTLLPALGFVNVYPFRFSFVADHFQYLAVPALVAVGVSLARYFVHFAPRPRLASAIAGAALLTTLGLLTFQQTKIYKNQTTLWSDTLAKNPDSWMATNYMGVLASSQGRPQRALELFTRAIALKGDLHSARFNRALTNDYLGQRAEAIADLRQIISLRPDWPNAQYRLGQLLLAQGDAQSAVKHLRKAVGVQPPSTQAMNALAWVLATHKDANIRNGIEALSLARQACELTGYQDPATLDTLGAAYGETGQFAKAIETAQKAHALAAGAGLSAAAKQIQGHLSAYRSGRPHRE